MSEQAPWTGTIGFKEKERVRPYQVVGGLGKTLYIIGAATWSAGVMLEVNGLMKLREKREANDLFLGRKTSSAGAKLFLIGVPFEMLSPLLTISGDKIMSNKVDFDTGLWKMYYLGLICTGLGVGMCLTCSITGKSSSVESNSLGFGMGILYVVLAEAVRGAMVFDPFSSNVSSEISQEEKASISKALVGLQDSVLIDKRDGHQYQTVKIGDQIWMAENLNYGTLIKSKYDQTNNNIVEKYIYKNNENRYHKYGGLYQWDEAMNYSTREGAQGICPDGWHIPTDAEWKTLEMALGMSKTEADNYDAHSRHGANQGTQVRAGGSSGFEVLFSGWRYKDSFHSLGITADFWSSSQYDSSNALFRGVYEHIACVRGGSNIKTNGFCIRCLKNQ